VDNSN
jgi:hypothetical protein